MVTIDDLNRFSAEKNIEIPPSAVPFLLSLTGHSDEELSHKIDAVMAAYTNQDNSDVVDSLNQLAKINPTNITLPLYGSSVSCGFTSPAEDHIENQLSLDDYLVSNPEATFFVRASGNSMIGAGIFDGDLLIIDRSLDVKNNAIVLAIVDTEFTVKRFVKSGDQIVLVAENDDYEDIHVRSDQTMMVWGVVVHVIHHLK
jgi:DNA polymerase V